MFALSIAALALYASGALGQLGRRSRSAGEGREKAGGREPVNPIEVTLHEFHEDLKLSPGQEAAWEAYVERIRALMSDIARERVQRDKAPIGVLQRLDRVVDMARDRLTAVEDIAISAKALYAQLTPEQQRVADPRLANIMAIPLAAGVARGAPAGKTP
jgi:hypothetical protein